MRLHIKANSNSPIDQAVKLEVRDEILEYLTPLIEHKTKSEAMEIVKESQNEIKARSNAVLQKYSLRYGTKVQLKEETYPTRVYEGETLEGGVYDSLYLELGRGEGDNWWCVIYPPLCYSSERVHYKSYLWELIQKIVT